MKTKNFLVVAVLLISGTLGVNGVFAETPVSDSKLTDDVTLKIVLIPIQAITVNPNSKDVEIVYDHITDYANGVTTGEIKDHLTVYSTGGFTVSVKSESTHFINLNADPNNNTNTIPVGDVKITAKGEGGIADIELSTTPISLIENSTGGSALKYNVTYDNTEGGGDAYINHYLNGGDDKNTFTATVTYTIAAK